MNIQIVELIGGVLSSDLLFIVLVKILCGQLYFVLVVNATLREIINKLDVTKRKFVLLDCIWTL